jgi:single-strand DNA-binding protein
MAGSVNRVILVGNLGKDPETRSFPNGGKVTSFSVATSEIWTDKATGQKKDNTTWHNIQVFNEALGEVASRYLKKGSKVYLEGAIENRQFTDREGNKREVKEVVLRFNAALVLLDSRPESADRPAAQPGAAPQAGPSGRH